MRSPPWLVEAKGKAVEALVAPACEMLNARASGRTLGNGRAHLLSYSRLFRPAPSGGATLWRVVWCHRSFHASFPAVYRPLSVAESYWVTSIYADLVAVSTPFGPRPPASVDSAMCGRNDGIDMAAAGGWTLSYAGCVPKATRAGRSRARRAHAFPGPPSIGDSRRRDFPAFPVRGSYCRGRDNLTRPDGPRFHLASPRLYPCCTLLLPLLWFSVKMPVRW